MSIDASRLQISVQEQERWRRRMSVTIPASVVAEEESKAAAKLAGRVKLKGFRKGKVPSRVVASRFGGALRQEALDQLVNEAYRHALASEKLQPISEGEIEELSYEPKQDLHFAIAFDVQPEIPVGRLGGFVVERPRATVKDEHVEEILRRIRERQGVWAPAEQGTPEDRDLVSVRIRKLDGEAEGAEGRDYELVLGEGQAIPDIESAIKTLSIGETGEFTATFPEDFPDEARRGAQERVEISLAERKTLVLPELDDDLARQAGDFESLDGLRASIRKDLQKDAEAQAEAVVRGRLFDLLLEANPFDVPRSMVERYTEGLLGDQPGLPRERIDEFKESLRPEAERAVKRFLMLDRIAQIQQLGATEEEIDERIEAIAEQNDSAPEKVYASLQKAGRLQALEREITERKVFDFLEGQSEITDAPEA